MTLVPEQLAPAGADRTAAAWRHRLVQATRPGHLRAAYQPILDVARGVITGYEALARFDEPRFTVEEWFAAARQLGLGARLEAAALRAALAARSDLPPNCFLAINVSPTELSTPPVREVLLEAGDLAGVVIELTEQVVVESYVDLDVELRRWRRAGALIAVDDAGAGYAGLRHLLELQPSIIKLDRHLIDHVDRDPAKRVLMEMIGTFADRTDAWLLAEGVERSSEMDVVAELGVPLAQGYFVSRPAPPWAPLGEVAAWLSVQARRGRPLAGSVAAHLQPLPLVDDMAEAAVALGVDTDLDWVVLADHLGRPRAVVSSADLLAGSPGDALRVNAATPVAQVLRRAMARPAAARFAPVIVIDDVGGYLGVAAIDRLVDALAG